METKLPPCPKCSEDMSYEDRGIIVCPMCSHEWTLEEEAKKLEASLIKDANGNVLEDGDTVTLIKELKIKGSNSAVKIGTKVKNIRLNPGAADGHDISCKIDGFGAMGLKSEFVKKV